MIENSHVLPVLNTEPIIPPQMAASIKALCNLTRNSTTPVCGISITFQIFKTPSQKSHVVVLKNPMFDFLINDHIRPYSWIDPEFKQYIESDCLKILTNIPNKEYLSLLFEKICTPKERQFEIIGLFTSEYFILFRKNVFNLNSPGNAVIIDKSENITDRVLAVISSETNSNHQRIKANRIISDIINLQQNHVRLYSQTSEIVLIPPTQDQQFVGEKSYFPSLPGKIPF